jgi:sugar transferase (PEP-CTERM/EpsH1 system associated)
MRSGRKIRVVHIIYSLRMGGAERVIVNYAKFYDKEKYELSVCALTEGGPYEDDLKEAGVRYIILNKKIGFDILTILKLIRLLKREQITIVHFHDLSSCLWGTIPALLSGVKVIIRTVHTIKTDDKNMISKLKSFFLFFMYFFHNKIIAVSKEVKRSHTRYNNYFKNKYVRIYNGIDTYLFQVNKANNAYYNTFNLKDKSILIGIIGRLVPPKAHEVFLEAIKLVLEYRNNAAGLVVGDGPRIDELIEMTKKLGIDKSVFFTGNRSDIPHILNLIDIFVLSSDREGLPMTILEAMACGKPVVGTDIGGNREAVIDGETGYIVPPRHPLLMSEAIIKLIESPELRKKMGEKGRERFLKNFTAEKMVQNTENIYEKCL